MYTLKNLASKVFISNCDDYLLKSLKLIINHGFIQLGGISNVFKRLFDKKSVNFLIKPNFLKASLPRKAVITHPKIIESIIQILLELNLPKINITVADSPGIGTCKSVAGKSGYEYLFKKYPVIFENVITKSNISTLQYFSKHSNFKDIPVWNKINSFDYIINVPKLKTHGHMGLTLAVKNLYGLIPGTFKLHQHLKSGTNHYQFARMLIELHYAVKPDLNIIDGILSMEGNGPGSGTPIKTNLIGMSTDGLSLDSVICQIIKFPRKNIPVLTCAEDLNFDFKKVKILPNNSSKIFIDNFEPAKIESLLRFSPLIPTFFSKFVRSLITSKPKIDKTCCNLCNICISNCPAKIMKKKKSFIYIDHSKCIKCFCCQEFCPQGAITAKSGVFSKLFK